MEKHLRVSMACQWMLALVFAASPSAATAPDLIAQADYVTECHTWHAPSYQWIAKDRIFHLRQVAKEFQGCVWQAGRVEDKPAEGFNRRIRTKLVDCKISPDRLWALMPEADDQSPPTFLAVSLDGANEMRIPFYGGIPIDFAWMPDSRGFVVLDEENGQPFLGRYALAEGFAPRRTRLYGNADNALERASILPGRILGVTPSGRVLTCSTPTQRGQEVELCEVALSGREAPTVHRINVEADEFVAEVELAQKGDKLAWLVRTVNANQSRRAELRVSKRDGNGMRLIGCMERDVDNLNPPNIRWMTGGESVSFTHRGGLYAANVRPKS